MSNINSRRNLARRNRSYPTVKESTPKAQENNEDTGFLLKTGINDSAHVPETIDTIKLLQDKMKNLCTQLSVPTNKFNNDDFVYHATQYISDHKRFLYSIVSDYIVHDLSEDQKHANFFTNLEIITANIDSVKDESTKQSLIRLYDHCMLARMQRNEFLEDDEKFKERAGPLIHNSIESAQRNITEQFVSLIAIFTALAFLIFGGLSSFESVFSQLKDTPICKLLMVSSVWGIGLLNLLALFFYFIFRISKLQFRKMDNPIGTTLFERYPILISGNFILLLVFIISALMYARNLIWNIAETIINGHSNIPFIITSCIVIVVFLIFISIVFILLFLNKKK